MKTNPVAVDVSTRLSAVRFLLNRAHEELADILRERDAGKLAELLALKNAGLDAYADLIATCVTALESKLRALERDGGLSVLELRKLAAPVAVPAERP